jgi:hypothetical protein
LKEDQSDALEILDKKYHLGANVDVIASQAAFHFNAQRYHKAYQLTKRLVFNDSITHHISIIDVDPFHQSLSLHLSVLVALNRTTDLYRIAHNMVI